MLQIAFYIPNITEVEFLLQVSETINGKLVRHYVIIILLESMPAASAGLISASLLSPFFKIEFAIVELVDVK